MIEAKRLKRIRSLQDIKLEKAKLRYQMLIAERDLLENMRYAGDFFTIGSIISRISLGLTVALKTYRLVSNIFAPRKKSSNSQNDEY